MQKVYVPFSISGNVGSDLAANGKRDVAPLQKGYVSFAIACHIIAKYGINMVCYIQNKW